MIYTYIQSNIKEKHTNKNIKQIYNKTLYATSVMTKPGINFAIRINRILICRVDNDFLFRISMNVLHL